MKLNYLYCFLFGIIIYFIFNNNEGFSVGIDDRVFDIEDEPDCDIHEDCPDVGEFCHNDGTCTVMVTKELLEGNVFEGVAPYPMPPEFMMLEPWLEYLSKTVKDGHALAGKFREFEGTLIPEYFRSSTALVELSIMPETTDGRTLGLREMISVMKLDRQDEKTLRKEIKKIPNFLFEKATKFPSVPRNWPETYLKDITLSGGYGYKFDKPIARKGVFKLYHIKFDDVPIQEYFQSGKKFIEVVNTYSMSGNSEPKFAVPKTHIEEGTLFFYLTEDTGRGEIIRSRALILLDSGHCYLEEFSTVPMSYGYGEKLMFLLSKARVKHESYQDLQIRKFSPVDGSEKAYRKLFRLSVGPTWFKKNDESFSIFKPSKKLMKKLYVKSLRTRSPSSINIIWDNILKNFDIKSEENTDPFYLFLMSLSEEDVQKYLKDFNLENTEQNKEFRKKYDEFIRSPQ
tara:strand:- start:1529 stop:2893 length:1365 start_codon:yes stop_codon:yes gene_type:complete